MDWIEINSQEDFAQALAESEDGPVVIYKHSSICSLSSVTRNRLERSWNGDEMIGVRFYFLSVTGNRELARQIQDLFDVRHESPQMLLIQQKQCVYHTSHWDISYKELAAQVNALRAA